MTHLCVTRPQWVKHICLGFEKFDDKSSYASARRSRGFSQPIDFRLKHEVRLENWHWHKRSGPWFNIKMTSYQYRRSHCGDKTILRPSYLHNGISYTDTFIESRPRCLPVFGYSTNRKFIWGGGAMVYSHGYTYITCQGMCTRLALCCILLWLSIGWLYSYLSGLFRGLWGNHVIVPVPARPTLTHWGRVTHICVVKLTIIGSDNGLSPGRRQAIIWTNAGILLIGPLGTNFIEILNGIQIF